MALLGNATTTYNVDATYHMIRSFNWDKFEGFSIKVFSYVDQASRMAGKEPLLDRIYSVKPDGINYNMTVSDLYLKLKLMSDFSSMIDG